MKYMVGFVLVCMVIGLWIPARARPARWIFGMTVALVVFFWIYPYKL